MTQGNDTGKTEEARRPLKFSGPHNTGIMGNAGETEKGKTYKFRIPTRGPSTSTTGEIGHVYHEN